MAMRKQLSLADMLRNIGSDDDDIKLDEDFRSTESLNVKKTIENKNNKADEIVASHLVQLFNQVEKLKSNHKNTDDKS